MFNRWLRELSTYDNVDDANDGNDNDAQSMTAYALRHSCQKSQKCVNGNKLK